MDNWDINAILHSLELASEAENERSIRSNVVFVRMYHLSELLRSHQVSQ